MFLLKKLISQFFFPLPLCLIVCAVGLGLLWFTQRQKMGKIMVSVGLGLLLILSYGPVAALLLRPLEYGHAPCLAPASVAQDIRYVVVLSGGHSSDRSLPPTSRLGPSSLARVVEGIRIQRKIPGARLLLSGGAVFDPVPEAETMRELALDLGMHPDDIVMEDNSRDTKDQARLVKAMVGSDRFCLVTSASHMSRAVAMFRKQGLDPIPVPTQHISKKRQAFYIGSLFPSSGDLAHTRQAAYEYMGLAWGKVRGLL